MAHLYQYYTPYECEEHMLYPSEIAKLFRVKTTTGSVHNRLICAMLRDYERESGEVCPQYYYAAASLIRVYPSNYYMKAVGRVLASIDNLKQPDGSYCYKDLDGKNHRFVIGS